MQQGLPSLGAWGQLDEVPMWPFLHGAAPQLLGALPAVSRAPRLQAHPSVPGTPAYLELMALLRGAPVLSSPSFWALSGSAQVGLAPGLPETSP